MRSCPSRASVFFMFVLAILLTARAQTGPTPPEQWPTIRVTWLSGRALSEVFGSRAACLWLANGQGAGCQTDANGWVSPAKVPRAWLGRSHVVSVWVRGVGDHDTRLNDYVLEWLGADEGFAILDLGLTDEELLARVRGGARHVLARADLIFLAALVTELGATGYLARRVLRALRRRRARAAAVSAPVFFAGSWWPLSSSSTPPDGPAFDVGPPKNPGR